MYPGAIGQAFAANLFDESPTASPESASRLRAELVRLVRTMNRVWTVERDEEKLRSYFHPSIAAPAGKTRREESRIGARLELAQSARITGWKETDFRVRVYGGGRFAVISYAYELTLDVHGQSALRTGRDSLALVRESNRWQIVADECGSYDESVPPRPLPRHESDGTGATAYHAREGRGGLRWIECDCNPDLGTLA